MIIEKTLDNGLELIIQRTSAPVAAFQVWVDVGSIDETPAEAGYSHFLEHMLFKGTKKRTTQDIAGAVEGAGGDMNAFTSFEHTVYYITGSNTRWQLSNAILADMVLGSVFKPTEFNPEKEVILEEIKRCDDSPDRMLYYNVYDQIYGKTGYGRPVIGFPKIIRACTPQKLKTFWNKWYSPSLMTLVVVGDVDPKAVEAEVRKTWGKVHKKPLRARRRDVGINQAFPKKPSLRNTNNFAFNSVRWAGTIRSCDTYDPLMPALDLTAMILGHGETSRLHRRLFRDEKLVMSISASNWSPIGRGMFNIDVETSEELSGKFRKSVFEELNKFSKEGPTAEELERAKVILETDRVYGAQSMEDIASRLGGQKLTFGNVYFELEYIEKIRELTAADVQKAAAKLFIEEPLHESALLPKGFDSKAFWGKEQFEHSTPISINSVAQKNIYSMEPKILHHTLSNGIELLMVPKTELPIVCMQACFMGGLRYETKESAGISNLLSDVWEKGPNGMKAEEFSARLEDRASRIDSFSGRNTIGLSSTTTTKHLEPVLDLFLNTLLNPALETKELNHAKELALEDIRTLEDNPSRLAGKLFNETLFEGHPYAFPTIGFKESVQSITQAALQKYYKERVHGERMVVSISGKFNADLMVEKFENLRRTPQPQKRSPSIVAPNIKAPRLVEAKKNKEQSHLIVGFPGITLTDPRRYDLKILLTVLGGQSGRLFREIRDKQGLCYTVSPLSLEGVETGYVAVYIGCDPTKVEQSIKSIRFELKRMIESPITIEELERAKNYLLGRHHMDLQMNSHLCSAVGFNVLYGLEAEELFQWNEKLKAITPRTIQRLSKELFTQPEVTTMVL